jgi:hypothetical protein
MSAKVVSFIFENSKTVGSARVLMLAIADMANNDGECWPGRANLARRVNVSVRQITRLIQECERSGELSVISERRTNNEYENNRYLINGVAADQRIQKARQAKAKAERKDTRVTSDTDDTTGSDTRVTETKSTQPKALKRLPDAEAPDVTVLPKAEKKSPLRSEGKPYPVYDALESRGWGIPFNDTAPRMWTQPIGIIAKWLTCEVWTFQKQPIGKNETPATAEDVFAFYDWWARNNPKATPPRNVFKFIEHWREWKAAVAKSTASGLHIFKSAEAS